jgi:uncharacterized membrane protein YjjB (DUF3815 family)
MNKHVDRFMFGVMFFFLGGFVVATVGAIWDTVIKEHAAVCSIVAVSLLVIYLVGWLIRYLIGEER